MGREFCSRNFAAASALVFGLVASWLTVAPASAAVVYFCDGQQATIVGDNNANVIFGNMYGPDVIVALGGNDDDLRLRRRRHHLRRYW